MVRVILLLFAFAAVSLGLDLTGTVVVTPKTFSPREEKAVDLLLDAVEQRAHVRWETTRTDAAGTTSVVIQNVGQGPAEGYHLRTSGDGVVINGNDERGVLFGIGRLLRAMRMEPGSVSVPEGLEIDTAPKYPLRGHQLGYRPKTNSYDGWTLAMWEQYIRDLAVFGTNAIELIPPRSDDAATSPHFPLSQIETMIGVSKICDELGLDVWIWYPALDKDYSNPETVEFALREWAEVFRRLPRINAILVPGGDPGHTHPRYLMPMLEKQAASLRKYHPGAGLWIAPQGFNEEWLNYFYRQLREEPEWLTGIVFGPWVRVSLPQLRSDVPSRYPIRHYPDITHSLSSQYPVPGWDLAYALTEQREPINPRPRDMAAIFRTLQPYTIGFIAYSEGCNDDVNKIVWSSLGWDPDTDVVEALRDYGRYFIGPAYADSFAEGLLALERNWRGALLTNFGVETTLEQFRTMERAASPALRLNWRFQQALYRAYYDAYDRRRLLYEAELEQEAMDALREAPRLGADGAMKLAAERLERATRNPVGRDLRARVFELAEALYQSIRMQLSVERYQAIGVRRGANLDLIDTPLNNAGWLRGRFAAITKMESEREKLAAIDGIVNWTNPGPGGYYDDLGNIDRQPHLVGGPGYPTDPAFLESALTSFSHGTTDAGAPLRTSWMRFAAALNDGKLQMHYTDLDPAASYRIRITYAGNPTDLGIRLVADGQWEVHPYRKKARPPVPAEFAVPQAATADGEVTFTWQKQHGDGGPGRGLDIAEVWLIREQ